MVVQSTPADFAMFSEYVILPSIVMVKDWEDKGKVVGGLFAGQRAGVIIIEATSGEELSSMLQFLPFWGQNTWENNSTAILPIRNRECENTNRQCKENG